MKHLILYTIHCLFFFYNIQSQVISLSKGKVESFAKYKTNKSDAVLIDSIVGQYRSIAIDTIGKKIGVEWLIENDTIAVQYSIEQIYITNNYNTVLNKQQKNLNILSVDSENFPLLILIPLENTNYLYLYYKWSNHYDCFLRSEKIKILKQELIRSF